MGEGRESWAEAAEAIRRSGLTIYDSLESRPELFIEARLLQLLLRAGLTGLELKYPLRTRSKVLKSAVCDVLGYPVPKVFRKTRPRFGGQKFDTYVQKSDNLQIWNEEICPGRRYVIIRVSKDDVVVGVRVVDGEVLALLDRTGTLTQKYQARSRLAVTGSLLVSVRDTANVRKRLGSGMGKGGAGGPNAGTFVAIKHLFEVLRGLCGTVLTDPGADQDRTRGGGLQRAVCERIGGGYTDAGQFPDIVEQLLEVKLQTSPTIDLGLISPDSAERLAGLPAFRHCDVRYAVFYGGPAAGGVRVEHVVVVTGEDFFSFFQRFEGKVLNKKLQIPLADGFFD